MALSSVRFLRVAGLFSQHGDRVSKETIPSKSSGIHDTLVVYPHPILPHLSCLLFEIIIMI